MHWMNQIKEKTAQLTDRRFQIVYGNQGRLKDDNGIQSITELIKCQQSAYQGKILYE